MSFNVGDIVEIVDSVCKRLIGEIGEIVHVRDSVSGYCVRFNDPRLHNYYHTLVEDFKGSRAFPASKLKLYEEGIDADISCDELMSIIGVDL